MTHNLGSVDLHSHTTYSDGSQSPAALVRRAKGNGVRVLAVTDHDHVGGIDEALVVGLQEGVEIIPGIELSVSYAEFEDIHLLAYYFAWHAPPLLEQLAAFRVARDTRGERILARINTHLIAAGHQAIAYEEVKAHVQGALGRPHIATLLVERGHALDMNAAFRDFLIPCNVPKYYMPAAEALALIRQTRGLSSVAHPKFITADRARLRAVIGELQRLGLDGIEACHSDHSADERQYGIHLAKQFSLTVTGGSDYHGFKVPGAPSDGGGKLGSLHLPYSMAVRLRQTYLTRYPLVLLLLRWPATAAAAIRRAFQVEYGLSSVEVAAQGSAEHDMANLWRQDQALVLHLPTGNTALIGALTGAGERHDRRVVMVPWETAEPESQATAYGTEMVSAARYQRTPVERLAHELVHEAILAQLR
jgi:hypothetical protein